VPALPLLPTLTPMSQTWPANGDAPPSCPYRIPCGRCVFLAGAIADLNVDFDKRGGGPVTG
jgi:hypothetical protein